MKMQQLVRALFAFLFLTTAFAAGNDFVAGLGRYLQITNKIKEQDNIRLAELKAKAESADLSVDQRKQAYKQLFSSMMILQGGNTPPARLDSMAQTAVSWYCPDKAPAVSRKSAKPGELGNVRKSGNGKIRMIIIPDVGFDGSVFESFMQRNQNRYTMYSVTLPGFGIAAMPPTFPHRDYAALRLWKNAETAILNLIDQEKLVKPVLMGHQGGAYLALRIALDHPKAIGRVVTLNGLLYAPLSTSSKPAGNLTLDERAQLAKLFLPIELFPRPSADCYYNFLQSYSSMLCKNPETAKTLSRSASQSDAHIVWDYYAELMTTDLTDEIQKFSNPLLVIPSIPDDAMPKNPMAEAALKQWQNVKLSSLRMVPFESTRSFATEDQPEKLDRLLLEFLQ